MTGWRYSCPVCGSVTLTPRVEQGGYRCKNCSTILEDGDRIDRKFGKPIRAVHDGDGRD